MNTETFGFSGGYNRRGGRGRGGRGYYTRERGGGGGFGFGSMNRGKTCRGLSSSGVDG